MKSKSDLNALIPTLVEQFTKSENHTLNMMKMTGDDVKTRPPTTFAMRKMAGSLKLPMSAVESGTMTPAIIGHRRVAIL